ncbi:MULTISPECIES: hypothetical protein [unclassified Nocardioides]|uniref:hypothetical protein n=1 Tax=unclassified Nocardioides TaxID=2615069 RepID=UPI000056FFBA|nr:MULTISPECIES: hypothetical protein [unclassified Nocardioides]ABL82442.1 hypothetical protein Noca_2940 [Nocardioides sp. JS614]
MNRRTMTVGLATLGIVAITGGGVAWATVGPGTPGGPGATAGHCAGPWGVGDGRYGMGWDEGAPMAAVADYLGLSPTDLADELRSGRSLAEIAEAQDKDVAGLKEAMLTAMERHLDANTALTDAQRDAARAAMASRVDAMIDGTYPYGMGPGHMGGMMGGGARGWMGGFGS